MMAHADRHRPVVVYPTSPSVLDEPRPEHLMAESGAYHSRGDLVRFHYSRSCHEPQCGYCSEGLCEQLVESCPSWERDVVTHGRPSVMQ